MKRKELTLLLLRRNDEVLLAMKKRGFGVGKWNGVGGKVEQTETVEQALVRECQEEIEVTPLKYEKVAELTFNELHEDERKIMFVNVFTCSNWEGTPTETEEMRPRWFNIDHIPYSETWSDDIFWLPLILDGKKLCAEFMMDDNNQVEDHTIKEVVSFL